MINGKDPILHGDNPRTHASCVLIKNWISSNVTFHRIYGNLQIYITSTTIFAAQTNVLERLRIILVFMIYIKIQIKMRNLRQNAAVR